MSEALIPLLVVVTAVAALGSMVAAIAARGFDRANAGLAERARAERARRLDASIEHAISRRGHASPPAGASSDDWGVDLRNLPGEPDSDAISEAISQRLAEKFSLAEERIRSIESQVLEEIRSELQSDILTYGKVVAEKKAS